ncbi:MAG: TetR/AcrR family transcriptional regulator C-terminal domain-containing protein [Oscillospiraceae bacterium]
MTHKMISMYTKIILSESLKHFMQKKPFSEITVSEITAYCQLNRKTFYYHFEDTRELLKWTLERETIKIVNDTDTINDYYDEILYIMDFIEKNQYMLNCVYDSVGCDELKVFLYNNIFEMGNMIVLNAEKSTEKYLSEEYKKLVVSFYTEGIVGIITEWLKGDIKNDKETTVKYICNLLKNGLPPIITDAR